MGFLRRKEVLFSLRLVLGVMFVYGAYVKILEPQKFAMSVRSYQVLPIGVTNLFAIAVAWCELLAGAFLVLGVFIRQAAGALLILLTVFIAAMIVVLAKGIVIDCGCFGPEGNLTVGWLAIARNLVLSAIAVWVMRADDGSWSVRRLLPARR
jgi:uncharacterized membrane protein YphA (DoxX/SURF4 family)